MPSESSSHTARVGRLRRLDALAPVVYFALLYAGTLVRAGVGIYTVNQQLQIPLVLHLDDPTAFPGDPFVATLGHYASPLWWLVALVARVIPLSTLLVALALLGRAFAMWAFGRLASALSPGSLTALVFAWLFAALLPEPFIGEGTLVLHYFEHTGVAVACAALAAAALVDERPRAFSIWLGITLFCNILYGLFALSYLGPLLFEQPRRFHLKRWAIAIGAALVLALPSLWMAAGAAQGRSIDRALWVDALRSYYPYHFFPDSWPRDGMVKMGLFLIASIAIAFGLRKRSARLFARMVVFSAIALCWIGLSYVNAYLLPLPTLFILHPIRGVDLFIVLATIGLGSALAAEVEAVEVETTRARVALCALLLGGLSLGFHESGRFTLLFAVLLGALALPALLRRAPRSSRVRWAAVGAAPLARAALVLAALASSVLWTKNRYGFTRPLVRGPDAGLVDVASWAPPRDRARRRLSRRSEMGRVSRARRAAALRHLEGGRRHHVAKRLRHDVGRQNERARHRRSSPRPGSAGRLRGLLRRALGEAGRRALAAAAHRLLDRRPRAPGSLPGRVRERSL